MSEYTHRTIIVPAAFQGLAQALCEAAAEGDAGAGCRSRNRGLLYHS